MLANWRTPPSVIFPRILLFLLSLGETFLHPSEAGWTFHTQWSTVVLEPGQRVEGDAANGKVLSEPQPV
jgi:hypothetical protein